MQTLQRSHGSKLSKTLAATSGWIALAIAASCTQSSGGGSSSHPAGTILSGPNGTKVIVDANQGGGASQVHVNAIQWGRLVDIQDFDPATSVSQLIFQQIVVRDDLLTHGDFTLDQDPITGRETLTIGRKFGTSEFNADLDQALHLQLVLTKSLDVGELPPFTALPRNCAALITFDDLIDPASITPSNLRVLTGYEPTTPFETRIIADANHGDVIDFAGTGHPKAYSTRIIVDFAISLDDATSSNPPLVPNPVGLPGAIQIDRINVAMRIPTAVNTSAGQFTVLRNLSDRPVAFTGNGPNDPLSPTLDVVRGMRSMGPANVTGDPNNGFLVDHTPPSLLGEQGVDTTVAQDASSSDPHDMLVDLVFGTPACAATVRIGDALQIGGSVARATANSNPPISGTITGAKFRVELTSDVATFLAGGSAVLTNRWSALNGAPPACFVEISPTPTGVPSTGLSTQSTFSIHFSEPVDPSSVDALRTFLVSRTNNTGSSLRTNIIGTISNSIDLTRFTFVPGNSSSAIPLTHVQGTSETYAVSVKNGIAGMTDLGGNSMVDTLSAVSFALEPTQASQSTDGYSLVFTSADEDIPSFGGTKVNFATPEVRGQIALDLARGALVPRTVTRFSSVVDDHNPVIGAMLKMTTPLQSPLSQYGSRVMALWRYFDLGLTLIDESTQNIDVEGLNWATFGSTGVIVDQYPEFQISLAHSKYLPNETPLVPSGLPAFPISGLVKTFAANLMDPTNDPLDTVHPRTYGYLVDPTDTFVASTGEIMQPWPLNRQLPPGKSPSYYTFRDTAQLALGAPNATGAEMYPTSKVPSIGLPLLMDFRCYSHDGSLGINFFQGAFALATATSAAPFFRAYSTGGVIAGVTTKVDPDNEPVASGGGIDGQVGGGHDPLDNDVYYGQADFVVRVSRVHTIWFDTASTNTNFFDPVVEPSIASQPAGTQVVLAYRGASLISPAPAAANLCTYINADNLDFYGDSKITALGGKAAAAFTVTYPNNDKSWKASPASINGSRFFQVRMSFISNVNTGLSPVITALGFPYTR